MIRSLSFIHLFVILTVAYIGGVFLYREMPEVSMENVIAFFDLRIVYGHEAGFFRPFLMTVLFFVVAFLFSLVKQLRFMVLFLGALKSALFGLSSAYLLGTGMKIFEYSVWWFPLQLIICLLFLTYCAVLHPPFFLGRSRRKGYNSKALFVLISLAAIVTTLEFIIFYLLLNEL